MINSRFYTSDIGFSRTHSVLLYSHTMKDRLRAPYFHLRLFSFYYNDSANVGDLDQISDVHGHLLNSCVIKLLNIFKYSLVISRNEVNSNTLTTETTTTSNSVKRKKIIIIMIKFR